MTELEIRPGTQPGDAMTLRGQGVTHLRGTGRGDLIVHANVLTPTRLDAEQEELLRQLAELRGEERPDGHARAPQVKACSASSATRSRPSSPPGPSRGMP